MTKALGYFVIGLFGMLTLTISHAQDFGSQACSHAKISSLKKARIAATSRYPGDSTMDVKYHKLDLTLNHTLKTIAGKVSTLFEATHTIDKVRFDLNNALKVSNVTSQTGQVLSYSHINNRLTINMPRILQKGELFTLTINYAGSPANIAGFGSMAFDTHGNSKSPVIWTLSEPYGAPNWWPCKDDPKDKIDSLDVLITMPPEFVSVSNGKLVGVTQSQNLKTYHWQSRYPIAHYLVSMACALYSTYPQEYVYEGGIMPIENYLYPEALVRLETITELKKLPFMFEYFEDTFGQYPFIKEKYGHAMFGFPGGMEHQTISSMGTFFEDLVVHELAHQWYGNKITCATWADIFMNEAFATYSEALWQENRYGREFYDKYISDFMFSARRTNEPIYISDISNEELIFDYNLSYAKGATVLHMLRGVLGDSAFFGVLKGFQASEYAYKSATINDFRFYIEKMTGLNLKYFFDQWIYGTSFPGYAVTWYPSGSKALKLEIIQTKSKLFVMPMQIRILYVDGKEEIKTIWIDKPSVDIELTDLRADVAGVEMDPKKWIMMDMALSRLLGVEPESKLKVYPNPVDGVLNIDIDEQPISVQLYDFTGKLHRESLFSDNKINMHGLPTGNYILKANFENKSLSKSVFKK